MLSLTDENTGLAIDLSASTTIVHIKFRAAGGGALLSTIPCAKTDAVNGQVSFNFTGGVLDVEPGMYEGEIEILFGTEAQTVYDVLKFRVREEF
jgi:hypothetical protein